MNYTLARLRSNPTVILYKYFSRAHGENIISRSYSKSSESDFENSQPLKFSSSDAAKWKAEYTRQGEVDDKPWEENDIDQKLGVSLYDRLPGLEEKQLYTMIEYNKTHGIETAELEKRLSQLQHKRKDASQQM